MPTNLSLEQMCQKYPNHLLGEGMNPFLGVMSAAQIYKLLPTAAQGRIIAKTNKHNFLQKRLTNQTEKLRKERRLVQVLRANQEREGDRYGGTGLRMRPLEEDQHKEDFERKKKKIFVETQRKKYILSSDDEESSNHTDDNLEEDKDMMEKTSVVSNSSQALASRHADTEEQLSTLVHTLHHSQQSSRQRVSQTFRHNDFTDLPQHQDIASQECSTPPRDFDTVKALQNLIRTEVEYQYLVIRTVLWADPRARGRLLTDGEKIISEFWYDEMELWKMLYGEKYEVFLASPPPALRTIGAVLQLQKDTISMVLAQFLGEGLEDALDPVARVKRERSVLHEQLDILRGFTTKWEQLSDDLDKYLTVATPQPRVASQGGLSFDRTRQRPRRARSAANLSIPDSGLVVLEDGNSLGVAEASLQEQNLLETAHKILPSFPGQISPAEFADPPVQYVSLEDVNRYY